jgi:non-lysosomal glucosylceramidase
LRDSRYQAISQEELAAMTTSHDIPRVAWMRRLDDVPAAPGRPKRPPLGTIIGMLPMILRIQAHTRRERAAGRDAIVDVFDALDPGPYMGVPLGGIGGGSIGRGWQGDFGRWQLRPGVYRYGAVPASQFSVAIHREGAPPVAQVLYPGEPEGGHLSGWEWNLSGEKSTYHALYPRAWTVYKEPAPKIQLTCRQISPVLPHNYRESSTPAGVFVWTIENKSRKAATVGLMATFQNGTGGENDFAGGHVNRLFREEAEGGEIVGVALHHSHRQFKPLEEGQTLDERGVFEDPLTFAIAAQARPGVEITYRTRFVTTGSGIDVWGDFAEDARLVNVEDERPSPKRSAIAAALVSTVEVPPGESREVAFALAWDMPLARFGSGRAYYRRYTRFYGREGDAAPAIARDALANYPAWEAQIEAWQQPILDDPDLPDWYKSALFNELYFITDGGTIWTDGGEGEAPPPEDDVGHFAYLEGHEYLMYNTYDVHFYASFALAMLWPELELSLQRDFARAVSLEHPEERLVLGTGKMAPRKVRGAVPHDIGTPYEDPWKRVNAYNFQDASRWKDLNPKFVLQVYRDYVATGDREFVAGVWEAVREALDYVAQFDLDGDGLLDNEGFPDQTYDVWSAHGASAYTGGLWLGALSAGASLADLLGHTTQAGEYRAMLAKGRAAYEEKLWNGEYYNYDSSASRHHDSIMADQMAGQWYVRACGLPSIVPEAQAKSALKKVFDFNVMAFADGEMGAVNGMRPDGAVDMTSMQSQEVWAGTTYVAAAAMLQEGLRKEAFATAKGIYTAAYHELGYWFQTPEAWDITGNHRSPAYMRPLAIWAIQWAWERQKARG